jgi:hypothetical protein
VRENYFLIHVPTLIYDENERWRQCYSKSCLSSVELVFFVWKKKAIRDSCDEHDKKVQVYVQEKDHRDDTVISKKGWAKEGNNHDTFEKERFSTFKHLIRFPSIFLFLSPGIYMPASNNNSCWNCCTRDAFTLKESSFSSHPGNPCNRTNNVKLGKEHWKVTKGKQQQ